MRDEDERLLVRRGVEHVRLTGAVEELGEIVPGPVESDDRRVTVERRRGDEEDEEAAAGPR
jgi:hypothetical protein